MNSEAHVNIAKAIDAVVSSLVINSTVAIVCTTQSKSIVQVGSGTLLSIADSCFLVTAAHVARATQKMGGTPGIIGLKASLPTALTGEWTLSSSDSESAIGDKYDIALYRLNENQKQRLTGCEFVRIGDVDFSSDLQNGYFVLCGFPSVWSVTSNNCSEPLILRPLLYGVTSYVGLPTGLQGFDTNYHLLFEAIAEKTLDHQGRSARMRTRSNHWVSMPGGLRGISGCSVWLIGNVTSPIHTWNPKDARIVGVETGVFEGAHPTIKASKWNAVLSLIYAAYSDLRPSIDLYIT